MPLPSSPGSRCTSTGHGACTHYREPDRQGAAAIERVRAILITPANTMLLIKRTKPDMAPYWVLPGGHADEGDSSLEAALRREIREELAGDATVLRLVDVLERERERQSFYLARINRWSFADRTGPEFSETRRVSY